MATRPVCPRGACPLVRNLLTAQRQPRRAPRRAVPSRQVSIYGFGRNGTWRTLVSPGLRHPLFSNNNGHDYAIFFLSVPNVHNGFCGGTRGECGVRGVKTGKGTMGGPGARPEYTSGETCTERVSGVFGCSRVECLDRKVSRVCVDAWGRVWRVWSLVFPHE